MTQAQVPVSPTPAARGGSGLFRSLRSRILLAVIILIVVLALIGWFIFQQNRAARSTPMTYDVFPGASLISKTTGVGDNINTETSTYGTPETIEKVVEFYTAKYGSLTLVGEDGTVNEQGNDQGCQLYKSTDNTSFGRCIVDNSQDDQVQRMLITVNKDAGLNITVISVQRDWAK
jgi:hypothetical protein